MHTWRALILELCIFDHSNLMDWGTILYMLVYWLINLSCSQILFKIGCLFTTAQWFIESPKVLSFVPHIIRVGVLCGAHWRCVPLLPRTVPHASKFRINASAHIFTIQQFKIISVKPLGMPCDTRCHAMCKQLPFMYTLVFHWLQEVVLS